MIRCALAAVAAGSASFTPISMTTASAAGSGSDSATPAAPSDPRPTNASIATVHVGSDATTSVCPPSRIESPIICAVVGSLSLFRLGIASQRSVRPSACTHRNDGLRRVLEHGAEARDAHRERGRRHCGHRHRVRAAQEPPHAVPSSITATAGIDGSQRYTNAWSNGAHEPSTRRTSATVIGEGAGGAAQLSFWATGASDGVGVSCGDSAPWAAA